MEKSIINTITQVIYGPETQISFNDMYFMLIQELLNLDFYSH